ncbi:glycosyltransferase family 20 [Trichoderma arundinaceum]|uniref:Glycosyltransferase family 20 n=1 Tax=Trichoderma arundinaceum TaxID=490622 RepID=A0A395NF65_TRIAR|nr:glycosyltransferase family 20 [Trichoderma arundinaceum]
MKKRNGWNSYCLMMEAFADRVCEIYQPGDIVMVHDYHLMMLPQVLRSRLPDMYLVSFLHTHCPTFDLAKRGLEQLVKVFKGALGSDIVALQAPKYSIEFTVSRMIESIKQTNFQDSRSDKFEHVRRYEGWVSELDYYALLRASDTAIFPVATNGLMTAGLEYIVCQPDGSKRPIIPDINPLAQQLSSAITYRPGDAESIARAMNHGLSFPDWPMTVKMYRRQFGGVIANTAERWMNSVLYSLVDTLLRCYFQRQAPEYAGSRNSDAVYGDYIDLEAAQAEEEVRGRDEGEDYERAYGRRVYIREEDYEEEDDGGEDNGGEGGERDTGRGDNGGEDNSEGDGDAWGGGSEDSYYAEYSEGDDYSDDEATRSLMMHSDTAYADSTEAFRQRPRPLCRASTV